MKVDLHWQILGVTRMTDSQIITQSGIFFCCRTNYFLLLEQLKNYSAIKRNYSNNKKNCSNNKIRVDLFIEPILEQKHAI